MLSVLNDQQAAVSQLINNTGVVFGALNQRYGQLAHLISASNETFGALSSEQASLADTFRVFPTFLDESKATLARLQTFSINTRPLVDELKPVADELGPTVTDVGNLSPDLVTLFEHLKPTIAASSRDLPQGSRFLKGAAPVLDAAHVFLPELNPILSYLNFDQDSLAHFLTDGGGGFDYHLNQEQPGVLVNALAQFGVQNSNSLGFQTSLPSYDRGNAYLAPNAYARSVELGALEAFSCRQAGGEQRDPNPSGNAPPCFTQPPSLYDGQQFPFLTRGQVVLKPSPRGTLAGTQSSNPNRPLTNR